MGFNNLKLEVSDEIATLTISRPAALNALNSETLEELDVALTEIEARDDVKVLILTGGPDKKGNQFKSFVAGADISEMVNFTAPEARAFGIKASVPFFKLMNMRQVTIAAVNGFALGGGCEIAMACDIRIASENAIFGQPEVGLGIIPGFEGSEGKYILFGDSAVCAAPTPSERASIAISACETAKELFGWEPRCAMLSFSTDGSMEHELVDQVRESVRIANERRPDLAIDGEFQLDAAIDPKVFGEAKEAIVRRQYPEVKAGDLVTFLYDDGKTETAAADMDGSVEVTFHQAGAFVAFMEK